MSLWSRYFGRNDVPVESIALVANPAIKDGPSLQLVFRDELALQAERLGVRLRAYHPSLRQARVELAVEEGHVFGLAGWDRHVVRLVGFNAPWPADALERCVGPSHYPQELKEQVRAHRSNLILYYAGYEDDPLERYVALAAVAGALADEQAIAVLNEYAHTSLPAAVFAQAELGEESLDFLRTLPLTMLYCGFVKYEVENTPGVWMRTYGGDLFGLPDFAAHADGHHQGQYYMNLFNSVMGYLRDSGASMTAGHTMQVGEASYLRLRDPMAEEYFLDGPGSVLVAEVIGADQINRG